MSPSMSRTGWRAELRELLTAPVMVLAVVLFAVYMLFDLREGGRNASLTTTKIVSPGRYGELFGGLYLTGMIVLNVLLSLVSAILMVQSYRMLKARRDGATTGACTTGGSILVGFLAFACPGCPLPLLGTLGITFFATSLPLYGLEFKLVALAMVAGALVWIRRRMTRPMGNMAPA